MLVPQYMCYFATEKLAAKAIVVASCLYLIAAESHVVVKANEGNIVGKVVKESAIFWGIPFGRAPIGELRWRSPRNPKKYEGKYWNATYARSGCPQICETLRKEFCCPRTTSEDCLYLNIWVPRRLMSISKGDDVLRDSHYIISDRFKKTNSDALPVMVFLHGGGFNIGSGSALLYDSRFLAGRGNVIVVTINYRLNVMGFLVQEEGNLANFGIRDQIKAMQWVKKNIAEFGGNPNKVTIFGQSAGAESIGILMTSSYGKGLFQQAILQSNPWSLPYRSLPEARRLGDKLAKAVGCQPRNMTCLRSISAGEITSAGTKVGNFNLQSRGKVLYAFQKWGPVIDGDLIARLPYYSFMLGKFHKMPVIMGNDRNEGYLFVRAAFKKPVGMFKYDIIISFLAGNEGSSIANRYPGCLFCDNRHQMSEIATDYAFLCPSRRVLFETGMTSWDYYFDATVPFKGLYANDACTKKVCHGSELAYIFDTVLLTNFTFNAREREISSKMQRYWTNFAKHGNPNDKARHGATTLEYWKNFNNVGADDSYNVLKISKRGDSILRSPFRSKCNYWDSLRSYGRF